MMMLRVSVISCAGGCQGVPLEMEHTHCHFWCGWDHHKVSSTRFVFPHEILLTIEQEMISKIGMDVRFYPNPFSCRSSLLEAAWWVDGWSLSSLLGCRSDVLGQVMPLVGKDWTQSGVARLFSSIKVLWNHPQIDTWFWCFWLLILPRPSSLVQMTSFKVKKLDFRWHQILLGCRRMDMSYYF